MKPLRVAAIAALMVLPASSQSSTPDLSGVWRLNPGKSTFSRKGPAGMFVKIEQNGSQINITMRVRNGDKEENQAFQYRAGSEENKNTMHGAPMTSQTRWEGDTLMIDSVADYGTNKLLHMNDRLKLSADGQMLTFQERHQFASEPPAEETYAFDRVAATAWAAEEKPKLAEEAFKNIQVLKGMPASRLMPVMQYFTRWLGVECSFCHVPNEFDKDDQQPKQTARKMLRMVTAINKDNFGGTGPVTCWMCHRGSAKPQSLPQ